MSGELAALGDHLEARVGASFTAGAQSRQAEVDTATAATGAAQAALAAYEAGHPDAPKPEVLLSPDFNSLTPRAPILLADFRTVMGDPKVAADSILRNTSIVAVPGRGNVIRQSFAASVGDGLVSFPSAIFAGRQLTEATISMDICWNGGIGWGCKIPGLGGINSSAATPGEVTGGHIPISTNGWSGRHMALRPGSGETKTDPDFSNYMYHTGQRDQYGDDILFGTGPVVGQWYTLETRYVLNTVTNGTPNADGILTSKWDGVVKTDRTDFIYRSKPDIFITHLYWAIIWGGAIKSKWAPTVPSSIDINNLLITTPG